MQAKLGAPSPVIAAASDSSKHGAPASDSASRHTTVTPAAIISAVCRSSVCRTPPSYRSLTSTKIVSLGRVIRSRQ